MVQPSGARLLAVHLCRASGTASGGELDSEEEEGEVAAAEVMDEVPVE